MSEDFSKVIIRSNAVRIGMYLEVLKSKGDLTADEMITSVSTDWYKTVLEYAHKYLVSEINQ